MKMIRYRNSTSFAVAGVVLLALALNVSMVNSATALDAPTALFLKNHCADCHNKDTASGGLNLAAIRDDLAQPQAMSIWVRVYDRVLASEMPPKDADKPTAASRGAFLKSLEKSLSDAHAAQKGTVFRRLNRREYQNTLNDLFGTNLDFASMLPPDGRSHEFENVGESLNVSTVQLRNYLDATDLVLNASIQNRLAKVESKTIRASYADTRGAEQFLDSKWLKLPDGAVVFYNQWGYPTGMLRETNASEADRYKIRVTGYAHQSTEPVTFSIGATTFLRGAEQPTFGYYSMKPGKPQTVEIEAWLESRYMVQIEPWGISDSYVIKRVGLKDYKGPGLAIQHVELEGPIVDEFPSRGHSLLFDGIDRHEVMPRNPNDRLRSYYKPIFDVKTTIAKEDARTALKRIATRAFRRPATDEQVGPYLDLFLAESEQGVTFEQALRTATMAIFCSPEFLFLREKPGELDGFALASRLSYFLTRSTPDAELLNLAASGEIKNPATLLKQTDRLLKHKHAARFIDDFTDAWLDLRNIDFTAPDGQLFPEFDPFLKHSMLDESRAFFRELITSNSPVTSIIKSSFAMLNNRLAEHYEIDGVNGPEIRRVALPGDSLRGGFLSQGAVLKVSANGTNTSPVVRGVWVMERILGQVPPPPPPGISGVEPDIRGATTLRELLDKHRDSDTCRVCHEMIDPPGFALESFDPIGGYRDRFRSLGDGERVDLEIRGNRVRYKSGLPVDASGELSGGRKFEGYREFRDLLASDQKMLTTAFASKLLTFAAGRELGFSDRPEISRIVEESIRTGNGVGDLVRLVVASKIFRQK